MLLVVINLGAGNGKGLTYWKKIEKRLNERKITYKTFIGTSEKETREFLQNSISTQSIHAIAVIGGDGTISSVLQDIAETNIPLAIFPAGSGNDTARMFQLTNDPDIFVDKICVGEILHIDLLQVNQRFGITVAGIGIDTVISETVNNASYKTFFNKIKLGSLAYIFGVFQVAFTYQALKMTITIHQQTKTIDQTWLLAAGNTKSYGGGLKICPSANPIDGQLSITIFHSLPRFKALLQIFPALLTGKKVQKFGVSYLQGTEIWIKTDEPVSAILDGEVVAKTPLHIKVRPKALPLLVTK